jgi:TRAP transporter TAXI family solute receptor
MKYILKIGIPLLVFIVAITVYIYSFIEPATEKKLSIATGRETGVYYQQALLYKQLLEQEGIAVEIVKTAGSIETLKLLNDKKVDIGFVQGGTATSLDKAHLKSVASLYFEPLWFFCRASLSEIEYLNELKDRRFSIGEMGSGTMALTQKLFSQTAIDLAHSNVINLNVKESYEAFKRHELDAFFTVLSPTSELIKEMMEDRALKLINLKRANAFIEYFPFLKHYKIYEGGMDLKRNIPNSEVTLLATTATLVTHDEVDNSLIRLITKKIKQSSNSGSIFPSKDYLEIPIHEASEIYLLKGDSFLEKIFPYWIASNIDRLKFLLIPLLTLLLPLLKGFVPLYRWRTRFKIYKWYKTLDSISERWEEFDALQLLEAQKELAQLSQEIRSKTNVPLSFRWEYHTLQNHIDNVINRMKRKEF